MAIEKRTAQELVVKAGLELMESGLIARTWGNVSARISDNVFVITPSGIPYEKLTPDDIVEVTIDELEYDENGLKPSSEKGVHAAAYKHHPEVDFVIHTHQIAASAVSVEEKDIAVPDAYQAVLGPVIPNAEYGMPSTGKLKDAVDAAIAANPASKAILMRHHGTVCLGSDYDDAFQVVNTLEDFCKERVAAAVKAACPPSDCCSCSTMEDLACAYTATQVPAENRDIALVDLGSSLREGDTFTLFMDGGERYECSVETGKAVPGAPIAPRVSELHSEIYKNTDDIIIRNYQTPEAIALSKKGETQKAYLDDFCQIAGTTVANINWDSTSYRTDAVEAGKAASGRNAILVKGQGALCTGANPYDTEAVKLVLEKEAISAMYGQIIGGANTLGTIDRILQRLVYKMKYSKQADKK